MPQFKRIDHIAIVVEDIAAALGFWQDALGLTVEKVEDEPAEKTTVAFLPLGESQIELVAPQTDDSGTARYLAKRGSGMHHLCIEVEGLEEILAALEARGVRLIHETPVTKPDGVRYAFIHPKSASGVLVELYEKPG